MILASFRITFDYLRENVDIVTELQKLGKNLFLVLHEKPGNYHYHGLLEITISLKTLRRRITEFACPNFKAIKGYRYVVVSDKVDDANGFKSYCLYRPGHPIKEMYVVNEDMKLLKEIADKKLTYDVPKKKGKLDKDLEHLLERCRSNDIRVIAKEVTIYYKELGRVLHIADIQRLTWSVYTYQVDVDRFVDHVINQDEGLRMIPFCGHGDYYRNHYEGDDPPKL